MAVLTMEKIRFSTMGTMASIHVPAHAVQTLGEDAAQVAIGEAIEVITGIDHRFSHYNPDSEIEAMVAGREISQEARDEIDGVLAACRRLTQQSNGAFSTTNPTTGRLDTAGYVKGYAIARAADVLTLSGLESFLIGIGGDCYASGTVDGTRPWGVMVAHPDRAAEVLAVVPAQNLAVATSGSAQRGEHIWNSRSHWRQLTVIGPRIELADAYATIAYALGPEAPAWLARQTGYAWLGLTSDDRLIGTFDS